MRVQQRAARAGGRAGSAHAHAHAHTHTHRWRFGGLEGVSDRERQSVR